MSDKKRFLWPTRPLAAKENIIKGSTYRFTVLTPALIRMEYDPAGRFEDRASQSVFYRDFASVSLQTREEGKWLVVETEQLRLTYKKEQRFDADTLQITLKQEPASTWKYGEAFEDLGGTASTLDGINGPIALGRGVCSRYGFSVLDDSDRMVLDEDGWVALRNADTTDVYFFGYGYDYLGAVKDYYRLTGAPVMLPAYALGNWWSRYYKYTQEEYIALMERFREENLPFSVAVVDMDWHIVETPEGVEDNLPWGPGWTGYSWNKELFPDYKAFLKYLADHHLQTALNLHPHSGCRWHEDMYEEMCKASGVDPATKEPVPFDILNPDAMANYFDILLHPYEEAGVNFWWMDWQQGTNYAWIHEPNTGENKKDEREVLNPLWMLNHLHILDISRNGKRPMFFSRFDGAGSQRYSIGFSGDTHVTWESLAFQPYFTATASNVGYCWWSHDIGGHMCGYRDDELVTRWMQLGVFSPINRLHTSCDPFNGKEPWEYTAEYEPIMKRYLRMRAELFPYLYTMNYRTASEYQPLVWPMYYTHPKCSAAYEAKNQFWFGSELMVAPITEERNETDRLGRVNVWFPKGIWLDFFNGTVYHSTNGRNLDVFRTIDDYPVFAKAGAIVPQAVLVPHDNQLGRAEQMRVTVFPGADNSFVLYEDEGEYDRWEKGVSVTTRMDLSYTSSEAVFTIHAAQGDQSLIPSVRRWQIQLRGFAKEMELQVTVAGKAAAYEVSYDPCHHTTEIMVEAAVAEKIVICANAASLLYDNCDRLDTCFEILHKAKIDYRLKKELNEILHGSYWSLHSQIEAIHCAIPSENHLAKALMEQLALEKDEFEK